MGPDEKIRKKIALEKERILWDNCEPRPEKKIEIDEMVFIVLEK